MKTTAVTETNLAGLQLIKRGKVRDLYDLGDELLIVATDRISTFDVVMPTPIPEKGAVLTSLSRFWFQKTAKLCANHLSRKTVADVIQDQNNRAMLQDRAMVVKKTEPLAVEAVVRGYLSGSGWKEYQETGAICGIKLPQGLRESDRLPEPIFTPSTKAEIGVHDENITFATVEKALGKAQAKEVRDKAIAIYKFAADYARARGIIVADTKFEFGMKNGKLLVIDEMLTPDSSRFWPADQYRPGGPQPSFDKQFVRDYLIGLGWNKTPPAPELPKEIVRKTTEKYLLAKRILMSESQ
jgi:phosphoribosylaminoimidazole-succinocarboxamide synthase